MTTPSSDTSLKRTPLYDAHVELGAKMVPFAGYEMPVQYPLGVLKEHLWTRENAGLFDVSHMGQAFLIPDDKTYETAARAFEALVPADLISLKPGQQRYSQLLADDGGILDDLMVSRLGFAGHESWLYVVVNAGCKEQDFPHIAAKLPSGVTMKRANDMALLALQGPKATAVMGRLSADLTKLAFMTSIDCEVAGIWMHVSRTGYTGEDGYEISLHAKDAIPFWDKLRADADVQPIGLGARDSLRLEAGLCLYGHDIDTTTSPIEAGLAWSIQKRRREDGGFPGAARIQSEVQNGPARRRVGIRPDGAAPAREGAEILSIDGASIGKVTSGGPSPCLGKPVAMGYVATAHAAPGTKVQLVVRGKPLPAEIVPMPFVPHRYFRK
jgi:aminomethyltransferase